MYEIFTYGRFEVEPANEQAFVQAWSEFAAWVSAQPGAVTFRLVRDVRNAGRFISFGQWEDADAVRTWKSSAEFKEGLQPRGEASDGVRADGARRPEEGRRRNGRVARASG